MAAPQLHTPYLDTGGIGASRPFAIGLAKLDIAEWIEVDDLLGPYLDEKQRLMATMPD